MPDIDLLGPGAAGASPTLGPTAPTVVSTIQVPDPADTFYADCTPGVVGTGTPIMAEWVNRLTQQVRRIIRNSGIVMNNAVDDMFGQAIQSNATMWAASFGGTNNVLTATLNPPPSSLIPGLIVRGIVASTNTSNATLNVNGSGPFPIVNTDATLITGGELFAGGDAELLWTGASWALISMIPLTFLDNRYLRRPPSTNYYINSVIGNDLYDGLAATGTGSPDGPWQGLTHALAVLSTYDFSLQTIRINLGLTGVPYLSPGLFNSPVNGVLEIYGDPSNQGNYVISGPGLVNHSVFAPLEGDVALTGVTITNTSNICTTLSSGRNAGLFLTNVTVNSTGSIGGFNVVDATNNAFLEFCIPSGNPMGCVLSGTGAAAIILVSGGTILQYGNQTMMGINSSVATVSIYAGGLYQCALGGSSWNAVGSGFGSLIGQRYLAQQGGNISGTGSTTFFPGNTAGNSTTGYYS